VPDAALALFRTAVENGKQAEKEWDAAFASYK
jgi:hypothetical protein